VNPRFLLLPSLLSVLFLFGDPNPARADALPPSLEAARKILEEAKAARREDAQKEAENRNRALQDADRLHAEARQSADEPKLRAIYAESLSLWRQAVDRILDGSQTPPPERTPGGIQRLHPSRRRGPKGTHGPRLRPAPRHGATASRDPRETHRVGRRIRTFAQPVLPRGPSTRAADRPLPAHRLLPPESPKNPVGAWPRLRRTFEPPAGGLGPPRLPDHSLRFLGLLPTGDSLHRRLPCQPAEVGAPLGSGIPPPHSLARLGRSHPSLGRTSHHDSRRQNDDRRFRSRGNRGHPSLPSLLHLVPPLLDLVGRDPEVRLPQRLRREGPQGRSHGPLAWPLRFSERLGSAVDRIRRSPRLGLSPRPGIRQLGRRRDHLLGQRALVVGDFGGARASLPRVPLRPTPRRSRENADR